MTDYSSRRERRLAESGQANQAHIFDAPYSSTIDVSTAVGSRRQLRYLERNPPVQIELNPPVQIEPNPPVVLMPNEPPIDSIEPALPNAADQAPKTNEIVLPPMQASREISFVLGSGEDARTGSIVLPVLGTQTGELSIVAQAQEADAAMQSNETVGYVSNIQPVAAAAWMQSAEALNILPTATNRQFNQLNLALTGSMILVGLGGLLLAAYMLGIFY